MNSAHSRIGQDHTAESLLAIATQIIDVDTSGLDDHAALAVASDCEKLLAFIHSVQPRALTRLNKTRTGTEEFVADEVAPALAWTRNTAAGRVSLAVDLTGRTPAALTALETGRIDLYKARILTEDIAALTVDQAREVTDRVLPRADRRNPTAFRRAVRRAILRVDPDGQTRRHETARADRRVVLYPLPDGMAELVATLPAEQATAIYQRIDHLARATAVTGDGLSADARRADVFTALLLNQPTHGPNNTGVRPLVQVTIAATTLADADDLPAELAGYGPIPAAIARRVATDPPAPGGAWSPTPSTGHSWTTGDAPTGHQPHSPIMYAHEMSHVGSLAANTGQTGQTSTTPSPTPKAPPARGISPHYVDDTTASSTRHNGPSSKLTGDSFGEVPPDAPTRHTRRPLQRGIR